MLRNELLKHLNSTLSADLIPDYCPNGLQVEGRDKINHIITGVTACEQLIDEAIVRQADAILVHHGYFWKGESHVLTGMKRNRIAKLLNHDINLIAYHLPLDVHETLGNNAQLGQLLNIKNIKPITGIKPIGVVLMGELNEPMTASELGQIIDKTLSRKPLVCQVRNEKVRTIAWCTGGGQSFIDQLDGYQVDAFLTGEASEKTIHSARELGIDFISAGHHATERYGVKALGEHLAKHFNVAVEFVDIDNPV